MGFVFLSCLFCKAETKVPCLIFTGYAENELCIDLADLNRITFGDNSMIVSSSKDQTKESIELLYSLYHHLEIGDEIPTDLDASIDEISDESNYRIYFDAQSKSLYLQSVEDAEFKIGIFNVSGNLLLTSELSNGDALMLETLSSGVYIAVATDGKNKISLKFIVK